MTTPLRRADVIRTCIENQIDEDIKQNKQAIDELVYTLILSTEDSMIANRDYSDCIKEFHFDELPFSCRNHAIQLTKEKLQELGYTVTRDGNDLDVTCVPK